MMKEMGKHHSDIICGFFAWLLWESTGSVGVLSTWYVSRNGSDDANCSQATSPCRTIQRAYEVTHAGDTIVILPTFDQDVDYEVCDVQVITVRHALTVRGADSSVLLGCSNRTQHAGRHMSELKFEAMEEGMHVTLTSMTFREMRLNINNLNHDVSNCVFQDVKVKVYAMIPGLSNFTHCDWLGVTICQGPDNLCTPTSELHMQGRFRSVNVAYGNFIHARIDVIVAELNQSEIVITDCVIDGQVHGVPVFGRNIIAIMTCSSTTVTIRRCTFRNQYNWNPIESVMNIYEAALLLRYKWGRDFDGPNPSNVTVTISECEFINNERALTLQGVFDHALIEDTVFRDNIVMHGGGGILALTGRAVHLRNCTFDSNAAGMARFTEVRGPGDSLVMWGDEVTINSPCCKGTISLIGKGGAIRLQRGRMLIERCSFSNNTARLLGGAVFVYKDGDATLIDSEFSNTPIFLQATQGDIIYSNGNVTIKGSSLLVKSSFNHISILQHSGDHWSMAVHGITILCPVGYRLRGLNTSAYGLTANVGLRRSYMLDQLSYFCESCPRHKYSLDRGYMRYKLDHGVYEYFTLMINGQAPNSIFHGIYEYHDITCENCPYGGECENTIRSLPNFWGYKYGNVIRFQQCPKGYCCANRKCSTYNGCHGQREGMLCARCREGFSEALFSPLCVPTEGCGPIWLWPFAFGMGFLYMIFLLFQKDMRDFIFSRPTDLAFLCKSCSKQPKSDKKLAEKIQLNGKPSEEEYELDTHMETLMSPPVQVKPDSLMSNDTKESAESTPPEPPPPDFGAQFLIILLFYFQDAMLFDVKTISSSPENRMRGQLKAVIMGFFKFRLEVAQFVDHVCLLPNMAPYLKLLVKVVLVPYVLVLFVLLFLAYQFITCLKGSFRRAPRDASQPDQFLVKLSTGFMLALLFTYQRLATAAFTLLNCVPIGDEDVLFIDGTVTCYTIWQYGILAYALFCIVPFCFALILGPGLLKEGTIGLPTFFLSCIIPLPFVVYWTILRLVRRRTVVKSNYSMSAQAGAVYNVLQLPFKDITSGHLGPTCWSGVLVGRRLILAIIFTFVNNTLIRILGMMFFSFCVLLHHVHVQPYKDSKGNVAGCVSVAMMMIIGGINLVRAGFEAAEYVPLGPNKTLMTVMQETENVLMLWIPLVIMCVVLLALFMKIILLCMNCCKKERRS